MLCLIDGCSYDSRVRPVVNHSQPTTVKFSMSLYQILSIVSSRQNAPFKSSFQNEKQQSVDLNVWVIQVRASGRLR